MYLLRYIRLRLLFNQFLFLSTGLLHTRGKLWLKKCQPFIIMVHGVGSSALREIRVGCRWVFIVKYNLDGSVESTRLGLWPKDILSRMVLTMLGPYPRVSFAFLQFISLSFNFSPPKHLKSCEISSSLSRNYPIHEVCSLPRSKVRNLLGAINS